MVRRGLTTWLSAGTLAVGLSLAMGGFSFIGCYGDVGSQKGKCVGDDDGNPCTDTTCPESPDKIVHAPALDSETRECARGENAGVCIAGACKLDCEQDAMSACKCVSDAECPMSNECVTWACTNSQCIRTDAPNDTFVNNADPNDCKKNVCFNGALKAAADEMDLPLNNVEDDCKKPACNGMEPSSENDDMDTPPDVTGDCKAPACTNGEFTPMPADDPPAANECVEYKCAMGDPMPTSAAKGKPCPIGECDGKGQCKLKNGQTCPNGTECSSGNCSDAVCCDTACTEECKSCAVTGNVGTCTNIPYYQEDNAYGNGLTCDIAVAGAVCDANGKCLRIVGTACTMGAQCISNTCTNLKCLGATGEICMAAADCASGMCAMGSCK